jgi:hypothetical protein
MFIDAGDAPHQMTATTALAQEITSSTPFGPTIRVLN